MEIQYKKDENLPQPENQIADPDKEERVEKKSATSKCLWCLNEESQ